MDLEIVSNTSSITVSWSAPFSLDVTGVDPDIWYSLLIYNVTNEDNPRIIPCTDCTNLTVTHYTFSPDRPSPCHKYAFTVIPYNGIGHGTQSDIVGYINQGKSDQYTDHLLYMKNLSKRCLESQARQATQHNLPRAVIFRVRFKPITFAMLLPTKLLK